MKSLDFVKRGIGGLGRMFLKKHPRFSLVDMSAADREIMSFAKPYTMTSPERLWSTVISVRHVVRNRVAGEFVECGVWRGGQAMAAALTFLLEGEKRDIWLFDTFAGMTEPTHIDVEVNKKSSAKETYLEKVQGDINLWCFADIEDVRANIKRTGYDTSRVHYIKGAVETTLMSDDNIPERIAILRLDTDWYESTKAELEILFPRLSQGGVLLIDDYGHWEGARRAVDEYFKSHNIFPLLQPIDYTGRMYLKYW